MRVKRKRKREQSGAEVVRVGGGLLSWLFGYYVSENLTFDNPECNLPILKQLGYSPSPFKRNYSLTNMQEDLFKDQAIESKVGLLYHVMVSNKSLDDRFMFSPDVNTTLINTNSEQEIPTLSQTYLWMS